MRLQVHYSIVGLLFLKPLGTMFIIHPIATSRQSDSKLLLYLRGIPLLQTPTLSNGRSRWIMPHHTFSAEHRVGAAGSGLAGHGTDGAGRMGANGLKRFKEEFTI